MGLGFTGARPPTRQMMVVLAKMAMLSKVAWIWELAKLALAVLVGHPRER